MLHAPTPDLSDPVDTLTTMVDSQSHPLPDGIVGDEAEARLEAAVAVLAREGPEFLAAST